MKKNALRNIALWKSTSGNPLLEIALTVHSPHLMLINWTTNAKLFKVVPTPQEIASARYYKA